MPVDLRVLAYLSTLDGLDVARLARCVGASKKATEAALGRLKARGLATRRDGMPGAVWYLAGPKKEGKP